MDKIVICRDKIVVNFLLRMMLQLKSETVKVKEIKDFLEYLSFLEEKYCNMSIVGSKSCEEIISYLIENATHYFDYDSSIGTFSLNYGPDVKELKQIDDSLQMLYDRNEDIYYSLTEEERGRASLSFKNLQTMIREKKDIRKKQLYNGLTNEPYYTQLYGSICGSYFEMKDYETLEADNKPMVKVYKLNEMLCGNEELYSDY